MHCAALKEDRPMPYIAGSAIVAVFLMELAKDSID